MRRKALAVDPSGELAVGMGSARTGYTRNCMWHIEPRQPEFTREERRFLSRAGRAHVPADQLIERVLAIVGTARPARGRQAFLAGRLVEQRLFSDPGEALAFAEAFYQLAKAGHDFRKLTWDWE